jgi:hypothetical protein
MLDEQAHAWLMAAVKVIRERLLKRDLPTDTKVIVMYEAKQDGSWITRALIAMGYTGLAR